ncbi:MAG TPA: hypothetical protein VHA33_00405 [Candidatus Angelobacter sp.]|nr:hypothetical protein [Candidatus Angelobacter sp.]
MKPSLRTLALFSFILVLPSLAAELQKKTSSAFDHYVQLTEARIAGEMGDANSFLWVDRQPEARRKELLSLLSKGQVVVQHMETQEGGKEIPIPDGMVHHWMATVFVPGVNLQQTLSMMQDFERHTEIYKADVIKAKVLNHKGDDFQLYLRLHRKTVVTVVYDTQFEIKFFPVDKTREYSRHCATRIVEVENAGRSDEHPDPVGNDRGFLWRLNTYWRYQEKNGGTYIQVEFITLSRSVPAIFAWLVNPYIKSIPHEYLTNLLQTTRSALTAKKS